MAYESDIINIAVVNFKVASGEKEVNLDTYTASFEVHY